MYILQAPPKAAHICPSDEIAVSGVAAVHCLASVSDFTLRVYMSACKLHDCTCTCSY